MYGVGISSDRIRLVGSDAPTSPDVVPVCLFLSPNRYPRRSARRSSHTRGQLGPPVLPPSSWQRWPPPSRSWWKQSPGLFGSSLSLAFRCIPQRFLCQQPRSRGTVIAADVRVQGNGWVNSRFPVGHFYWLRETLLKQHGSGGTVRVFGKALGRLTGRSQWQELVRRMAGAPSRARRKSRRVVTKLGSAAILGI